MKILLAFMLMACPIVAQHLISPKTSQYTVGPAVQPLIIIGEGWLQQFTFINVDYYAGDPTVGTVSFFTKDGIPWRLPLKNLGTVDHVNVNLSKGQMTTFETEVSLGAQQLGWAKFELSNNTKQWGIYHAFTVFRKQQDSRPDFMTSVPLVDGLEDNWVIPFDNIGGKYPGVGVVNTSTFTTSTFNFQVFDTAGTQIKIFSKTVRPLQLAWFSLVDENPDLAGKAGQIKVTGGLFSSAVFSLQFAPNGAFTALPLVHTFGM